MKKRVFLLFLCILASIAFFYKMQTAYVKEFIPFDIKKALLQRVNKKSIEEKITLALQKDNPKEAKEYLDLANFLGITIDQKFINKVKKANTPFYLYKSETKKFFQGFITGKANNTASLSGAIVSDFTLIGDLRDIYREGKKMQEGKEYDKFTFSLALLGAALSIGALNSFGSTLAFKSETALLKNANKMHLLKEPLKKEILQKLQKSVDLKKLQKINFHSLSALKKDIVLLKKSIHPQAIQNFLFQLHTIKKYSSTKGVILILKNVHNEKELQKAVKLSKKYKKLTPTIFKVLGREALRSGKWVLKKANSFIYFLIGFIFSLLGSTLLLLTFSKKLYSSFFS